MDVEAGLMDLREKARLWKIAPTGEEKSAALEVFYNARDALGVLVVKSGTVDQKAIFTTLQHPRLLAVR